MSRCAVAEPTGEGPDRRVIACNYIQGTTVAAPGASAYVCLPLGGNLPERACVVVRSRGGRWVQKWEDMRRLGNFRLKTLPAEHPRYGDERIWDGNDEYLERLLWAAREMGSSSEPVR